MTRQEVYQLLDGERAYQNSRWPDDPEEVLSQHKTPLHFVVYMQQYLHRAVQELTFVADPNYQTLLDNIRKVSALGVAAMEKFGAPSRQG